MQRELTAAQRRTCHIAVPTGIITAELAREIGRGKSRVNCGNCERSGHEADASYCKYCGARL